MGLAAGTQIGQDCRKDTTFQGAKDPDNPTKGLDYLVRRDPDDISSIFFLDPNSGEYHQIPTLNPSCPKGMTLRDWKATKSAGKKGKSVAQNEELRFQAYLEMRRLEQEAIAKSKQARRSSERRRKSEERTQESPIGGMRVEGADTDDRASLAAHATRVHDTPAQPFMNIE